MRIAILLFDGMTALDAIGPYEVLSNLPGADVKFVADRRGMKRADTRALRLSADFELAEVTAAEIVVIPGGPGDQLVIENEAILKWLRAAHEASRWTTSVCSGSLILGAAGLLRGKRATSHWLRLEHLRAFGAIPIHERVVEDGKIITAAGVSAGIDMALRLAQIIGGDDLAQGIQLGIEYDPQPPFDAGSPETAPPYIVERARLSVEQVLAKRAALINPT